MSTAVDHHEAGNPEAGHGAADHGAHASGHHSDLYYVRIALVLAGITALEVLLSYSHIGKLFLPTLLILMTIKFVMVVLFFMHLKFDSRIFSFLFWSGLLLAVAVYLGMLSTYKFFLS